MQSGDLDRRITLQSPDMAASDFSTVSEHDGTWSNVATVWASFRPVNDGEKWRAGMVESREVARFTIRYSSQVSSVDATHRLTFNGNPWGIMGIKEIGRREFLEITAERVAV